MFRPTKATTSRGHGGAIIGPTDAAKPVPPSRTKGGQGGRGGGRAPHIGRKTGTSRVVGIVRSQPTKGRATDDSPCRPSALEGGIARQSSRARYRIHPEEDQKEHGVQQARADVGVGSGVGTAESVRDRPEHEAEEESHDVRQSTGDPEDEASGKERRQYPGAIPPEPGICGDHAGPIREPPGERGLFLAGSDDEQVRQLRGSSGEELESRIHCQDSPQQEAEAGNATSRRPQTKRLRKREQRPENDRDESHGHCRKLGRYEQLRHSGKQLPVDVGRPETRGLLPRGEGLPVAPSNT